MFAVDRNQFRGAALSSIAPPGATSLPTRAELLERELTSSILAAQIARRAQESLVAAIVEALRCDVLNALARKA